MEFKRLYCDPDPEDFFLTGYDNQYETDYFAEAKKFDYQYLESFRQCQQRLPLGN
jgi:hypothetical protein